MYQSCMTALIAVFSVYMVLSYGFQYFYNPNFTIVNATGGGGVGAGEEVTLVCEADDWWEWCRWVHKSRYCEWEGGGAAGGEGGVTRLGCSLAAGGPVERAGNYSRYQCGLTFTASPTHTGVWVCELERYHRGFSRRSAVHMSRP